LDEGHHFVCLSARISFSPWTPCEILTIVINIV